MADVRAEGADIVVALRTGEKMGGARRRRGCTAVVDDAQGAERRAELGADDGT
jgi:hypothetical protein